MRASISLDGLTLLLRSEVKCVSLTVARLSTPVTLFPRVSFLPRYFFLFIDPDKFHGSTFFHFGAPFFKIAVPSLVSFGD
jgi:hypothetical protein